MRPILFHLPILGTPITSYGVFLATAFLVAMYVSLRESERMGLDPEQILNLMFVVTIASVVGARLYFVFFSNFEPFRRHPMDILKVWNGGASSFGGIFVATAAAMIYLRIGRKPIMSYADAIAPALPLGVAFGRLGCFANGCCYGRVTTLPWAVTFTHTPTAAQLYLDTPLHPYQIYESLLDFGLFLFLVWLRGRRSFRGQLFFAFFFLYGFYRFFLEFTKNSDTMWLFSHQIRADQVTCAALVLISSGFYLMFRRSSRFRLVPPEPKLAPNAPATS